MTIKTILKWLKILNEKYLALPSVDDQMKVDREK